MKYENIFCMDSVIVTIRFNIQDRDLMSEMSVKNVQQVQYDWNQQTVTKMHTKTNNWILYASFAFLFYRILHLRSKKTL